MKNEVENHSSHCSTPLLLFWEGFHESEWMCHRKGEWMRENYKITLKVSLFVKS